MWMVSEPSYMVDYPNRLREWRERRGLSQQQLADMAGCSKVQISTMERGRPSLDIKWMQRLAPLLQVAPGELLNPEDNPGACQSEAEKRMIVAYRKMPTHLQAQLLIMGEVMATGEAPPRQ